MPEGSGPVPPPGRARFWWKVSVLSAAACLILSWSAFYNPWEEPRVWWKPLEALYSSVQLLLGHISLDELPQHFGWRGTFFHIARVLAVVFIGATAGVLVYRFFGNELLRIGTAWRGHHTVICGYNRIGRQLVLEFSEYKPMVIDNEPEAGPAHAPGSSAGFLEGNPADPRVLSKAAVWKAARVFAALDDDGANIGIAVQAVKLAKEMSARPHILVHVTDPQLRATLRLPYEPGMPRVSTFNVFENSARLLLLRKDHQLDYVQIRETDERRVQLIVVGFGLMGEAIVTRAAMAGHYANLRPLRVIVIDRHAARKARLFRARHKHLDKVVEAHFLELDAEEPSTQAHIAELCADTTRTISTVAISFDNDSLGLSLALSLVDQLSLNVPIRLRLNEESGLTALQLPPEIARFGSMHDACASVNWINEPLDVMARALNESDGAALMARALHDDHVQRVRESHQKVPGDRSLREWAELDDDLIDSNRQAADHIWVKLRALGYHAAQWGGNDAGALITEFTPQQIELLAKMEHQRWMAERYLAGWSYGLQKDVSKRISPYLVPWDQLPDSVQEYDRDFARILPRVLKLGGWEIRY